MPKILAPAIIMLVGFALACNSALALSASDLDGRWIVTWPGNTQKNTVKLTYGGGLAGVYVNDSGALCPVSGTFSAGGGVTLHIVCPKWDIRMNGTVVPNGGTISGSYTAYGGKSTGAFTMVKQVIAGQPNVADRHCVDARQTDGSVWRTCVGDDARMYCEQCRNNSCSRVTCQ